MLRRDVFPPCLFFPFSLPPRATLELSVSPVCSLFSGTSPKPKIVLLLDSHAPPRLLWLPPKSPTISFQCPGSFLRVLFFPFFICFRPDKGFLFFVLAICAVLPKMFDTPAAWPPHWDRCNFPPSTIFPPVIFFVDERAGLYIVFFHPLAVLRSPCTTFLRWSRLFSLSRFFSFR